MSLGGYGAAYEAAKAAHMVNERRRETHTAQRSHRQHRSHNQMLSHIIERKEQLALLDSIEAQLSAPSPRLSDRNCPECNTPFALIDADGVELDTCLTCGSFWLDSGELKSLTHRPVDIPAEKAEASTPSRFQCPVCSEQMQEHRFRSQHDLLVDHCPKDHGVYLERDELVRAIDLTTALRLRVHKECKKTQPIERPTGPLT